MPKSVLRAKGVLRFAGHDGERAIFQLVGKRSSLTFEPETSHDPVSSVVFIGGRDAFEPTLLQTLFAGLETSSPVELTT